MRPVKYRKKPFEVEGLVYYNWADFLSMIPWAEGKVYFVPVGAEHPLRRHEELVGGNEIVIGSAPSFIAVITPEGETRADPGDMLVKTKNGEFFVYPVDEFNEAFETY